MASQYIDSGLFDEILKRSMVDYFDVNHDDAIGFSLLNIAIGKLMKNEKVHKLTLDVNYELFLIKNISKMLSKESLGKGESIICKGFVSTLNIMIKNSTIESELLKGFISNTSFENIFQKKLIIESIDLFEIFGFGIQNKLIKYEMNDLFVDLIPYNSKVLSILVSFDDLSKKAIPYLINILTSDGIFKSDFVKTSKKSLAIELLMKIDLSDQEKLTNKVLELLSISSKNLKRFSKFCQLCVQFLKKGCILDSEDNVEICKRILMNEEKLDDSTNPLSLETALSLEILSKLLPFLHIGSTVFNRVYTYFTALLTNEENLKKLKDTFIFDTINEILGKEFVIKKKQSMLTTPRGQPRHSSIPGLISEKESISYIEKLMSKMKDVSNSDVKRILTDEVPLKYLRITGDFYENLSEISDISDIEDEISPEPTPITTPIQPSKPVKRVHRQSIKFMKYGKTVKNEDSVDKNEIKIGNTKEGTKTMWSYYETDFEEDSLDQFLNIYLGKEEKDTIYDLLVEEKIFMTKSDQNMLQSEFIILKLLYTMKDQIYNLSIPNILEFILRVCSNDKLSFEFVFLIICIFEMLLKDFSSLKFIEKADYLKDICKLFSLVNMIILRRLKLEENQKPKKFDQNEFNLIIHFNNLWKLLIEQFLSFVFVDEDDYFNLGGESSSKS